MYKHLTQSDVTVRPFKTFKNWTIQSIDTSSVDTFGYHTYNNGQMVINEGLKISGVFYESSSIFYTASQDPVNPSGEYKRITYSQAQAMFYSDDNNPLNQFGGENMGRDPNTGNQETRVIGNRILSAKIIKNYWDEKIKPNSVHLTDNSNPHTIYEIYDDGYTNLYITSSHFSTYNQLRAIKQVESKSYYFEGSGQFFFQGNPITFAQARAIRAAGGETDYIEAPDSWRYPPMTPPPNIYDAKTERFGFSTSAWYKYIAVGCPADSQSFSANKRGQVDLFQYDNNVHAHRLMYNLKSPNYPTSSSISASFSASMYDSYGWSVSIKDNYMAIGAPNEDPNVTGSSFPGMVYVYHKFKGGADHWGLVATLKGSGSAYKFGEAVSISDDVLVVGAPGVANFSGSVYVFRNLSYPLSGSFVWNLEATLTSSLAGSQDYFGSHLEVSSGKLVVGNRKENGNGYAALFTSSLFLSASYYSGGYYSSSYYSSSISASWSEYRTFVRNSDIGDLNLDSPFTSLEISSSIDGFGRRVALDGNNMAICAFADRSFIISSTPRSLGAVYFYNYGYDVACNGYDFTFANKTYGDRSFAINNNFARSVSLRGGTCAVGYLPDKIQYSASLSGPNLLFENFTFAGSNAADVTGVLGRVSIYSFDSKNVFWSMINTLRRNKEPNLPSYNFGYSVALSDAISGSTFLSVGSPVFTSASNAATFNLIRDSGSYYSTSSNSVSFVSGSISGSTLVYNLDDYEDNPKIGNVFYKNGQIVITTPGRDYQSIMTNTGSTGYSLSYQGTHTIYEHEYLLRISPGDFNFSTNPSSLLNQPALFDVNQDGIFDFKDVDLIMRFLNKQRYYTVVNEDDNGIVLNQDTLEDESWWNADILQLESVDVLKLEALFVANQTASVDLSGGILTDQIYKFIQTNLIDTMILDIDNNGTIDSRDGAILLHYWLGTLTEQTILQFIDDSSKRIYYTDIKNYIEQYTGILNGFVVNPIFHEYLTSSSYDPTGSYLAPVITTIGLYDESNELAIVGKLGRPIKNLQDWPINIIVRFDT